MKVALYPHPYKVSTLHVTCSVAYPLPIVRWIVVLETCLCPSAAGVSSVLAGFQRRTHHVNTRESSAAVAGEFSSMHEVKKRHALLSVAQHPTTK